MAILLKFPEKILIEGEYVLLKPGVTEEEFWEISNEDSNFELLDGVLVIHSPASKEHEDIFSYLNALIRFYLEANALGQVYGSRLVMRLSKKWNPEPDLFIITPENYSNMKKSFFDGPADIVIEILSMATREIDLSKKLPKYLEAGVKEVWIIDPE
ncbi:MAG: Uma2 family endonuclease, partial [Candidatus Hodarchaeales archaeon]